MQEKCQVDVQALQSKLWQVFSRYARMHPVSTVNISYLWRGTKILDLDNLSEFVYKHPLCKFILF